MVVFTIFNLSNHYKHHNSLTSTLLSISNLIRYISLLLVNKEFWKYCPCCISPGNIALAAYLPIKYVRVIYTCYILLIVLKYLYIQIYSIIYLRLSYRIVTLISQVALIPHDIYILIYFIFILLVLLPL